MTGMLLLHGDVEEATDGREDKFLFSLYFLVMTGAHALLCGRGLFLPTVLSHGFFLFVC
jgi:hypothetical protein